MKVRIVFSGLMAAILINAGANAAQIASKDYVDAQNSAQTTDILSTVNTTLQDYSTTTQTQQAIDNSVNTAVSNVTANVDGKADMVTGAANGNLAGLDATGNLTDSGLSANTVSTNITNLQTSVTGLTGDVSALQTASTAAATALDGKADLVAPGTADMVATVDANGQYVRSATPVANIATTDAVNSAIAGAISDNATTLANTFETIDNVSAGLALKEDVANKAAAINTGNTGSTTAYTTVSAVENYALPRPPSDCLAPSAQCVLAINKDTGSVYWENVVITPGQ